MFRGRHFLALYRKLCVCHVKSPQVSVTCLPISKQLPLHVYILPKYLSSKALSTKDQLLYDITEACLSKKRDHLYEVLSEFENQRVKLSTPIHLTNEIEDYFRLVYKKTLKKSTGVAILRFICNHGETDSELERDLINQTLRQKESLSALQLANFIDCIKYTNTDLRWTLLKTFDEEIEAGLASRKFGFLDAVKSLFHYENTALQPYLLKHCSLVLGQRDLASTNIDSLNILFEYFEKSQDKHYELFNKSVCRQMAYSYKKKGFNIRTISMFLSLTVKYEFVNIDYFRFLANHLVFSLDKPFSAKNRYAYVKRIVNCLVSLSMAGYRDDESIDAILKQLKENEDVLKNYDLMPIFCALSVLNIKDLSITNRWNFETLYSDVNMKESRRSVGICALAQQEKLTISEVESLLQLFAKKAEWRLGSDFSFTRSFFTIKAYSELVLNTPISNIIDEETFVLPPPPVEAILSPLKKSVVFVAKLLAGDESLLRCFYLNKYQHLIDADFYVDDSGTIRHEDYDGPLTRILLVVLNQSDLVICDTKRETYQTEQGANYVQEVHYEPRGLMNMFLHHLKLAEKAEIITINFYEWNAMTDRHERIDFLKAAIQSKLQQKQSETSG